MLTLPKAPRARVKAPHNNANRLSALHTDVLRLIENADGIAWQPLRLFDKSFELLTSKDAASYVPCSSVRACPKMFHPWERG